MSAQEDADRKAALENLTPEERAAIEDDELDPAERAALEDLAGDDDNDDGDDDEQSVGSAKPDAKAADHKQAEAKDDKPAITEEDSDPSAKPRVSFKSDLPEDFEVKVKALEDQEADYARQFKAGEIDAEEFIAANKRITREQAALDAVRIKAEMAKDINEQTTEQEWKWTVSKFLRQVKRDEGIDYSNDAEKGADFDNFVKALAANPKHNDKDYEWFLSEAHKRTKVLHGVPDKSADPVRVDPKKANARAPGRTTPVSALAPTLAQVPGGDGPGDVSDEFAALDGLDGLEYETALAKMTPSQRDRYLRAA